MPRFPSVVFGAHARPRGQAVSAVVRAAPQTAERADVFGVGGFRQDSVSLGINPERARQMADDNPWVRAAISSLKSRVSRAERAIVPIDHERPWDKDLQRRLTYLLENPNPRGDSWRTFIEPVLEDFLVVGKGGWEFVPNFRGWPLALIPFNAKHMKVDPTWIGDPRQPRYLWRAHGQEATWLLNSEVTLMLDNPSTHRPEGWSKMAILRDTLEGDAAGNRYVRSLLDKYLPPGWLDLGKSATERQVKAVANELEQQVLGTGGTLVTGNLDSPKFTNLWAGSSRENELRDWSEYFAKKVAIVYGVNPMDLGLLDNTNKATAQVQSDIALESGSIGLLLLIEEYWNREVVGKFGTPETINLALRFKDITWAERERRATMVQKLSGNMPTKQLNELRALSDDPPIKGGNAIYVVTREGVVSILGEDAVAPLVAGDGVVAGEADAAAQGGAMPGQPDSAAQEDVAGNKPPGSVPTQTELAEETKKAAALAEVLVAAYLRVGYGRVDWARRLEADDADDLRRFVTVQVERYLYRAAGGADAATVARVDRAVGRLAGRLAGRAQGEAAYALLEQVRHAVLAA